MMWLSGLSKLSHHKKDNLLRRFGCAGDVFKASERTLGSLKELSGENVAYICGSRSADGLEKYAERVYSLGADYIIKDDGYYPDILREAYEAPLGLYIRGDKTVLSKKTVSMVGTRKATPYGMSVAEKLSGDFAAAGAAVVSGMADGIDAASHRGALKAGGKTIAVFGCGINICYPKTNERLMERIISSGCVLSEYPLDESPYPYNFPRRNRIIAGLSMALVVVEAEEKGGSLITANLAADFGREVFAVPGNITSRASRGTNELLKSGATPITEARDAFFAAEIDEYEKITSPKEKISLEKNEKLVYDCIQLREIALDEILSETGLDISDVKFALINLEMKGLAARLPASKYTAL